MQKITVHTSNPYDVVLGHNLLLQSGTLIQTVSKASIAAIITDDLVGPLYQKQVEQSLQDNGYQTICYNIPHGEASKNITNLAKIYSFLAQSGVSRKDIIVALGGGVVGDLAGFAAATYLRGIAFINIPTTFLAAIDSSVGGKTAIDIPEGKNLAGAFWQPSLVIIDTDTFSTLPDVVFADGVAEGIKYGAIADPALFSIFANGDVKQQIEKIVKTCVTIKANIVSQDEHENGMRMLLNFGHTLAHAIEQNSDYTITHGHAVAIGMVMISKIAEQLSLSTPAVTKQLIDCIQRNQLPTTYPIDKQAVANAVLKDKKRAGNTLHIVLLKEIGTGYIYDIETSIFLKQIGGEE